MRRLTIHVAEDAYCELRCLARRRNLDVIEYVRQAVALDKMILERRPLNVLLEYPDGRLERVVFNHPERK